ncbi:MAG: metal-dependent transcriptional regulator [Candidatus Omnitrophica bacterium]|nr:metal-dependent transcriptional regulator [Candidatus Omnitrophota bacterium]
MKRNESKKLTSNMEDYLEAIAALKKKKGVVRVRDISCLMDVKTPSVTAALSTLSEKGLVLHERYGYVEVTSEGERLARGVQGRHDMLLEFLTKILNIAPKIAAEDACKMEHSISPQTFQKLTKFIKFVETCPDGDRPDWLKGFDYYYKTGKRLKCKTRVTKQKNNTVD